MNLLPAQLRLLEEHAIEAALRAGEMIQSRAKQDVDVLQKTGGSTLASQVVTEVDLESQRLVLDTLHDSFERYGLGLLTEESPDDSSRHARDHFWCIDPLDGTLAFTQGSPGYAVSIALISRDGTPKIGVIYDPSTTTLYHATEGLGARRNREPWSFDPSARGDRLTLCIDHSFVPRAADPAFRLRLDALATRHGCTGVEVQEYAGAVLNACRVAERAPALYFKFPKPEPGGGSAWDFAATACLFAELGLPASDIDGRPLRLNPKGSTDMNERGVLFASDPELAASVESLRP